MERLEYIEVRTICEIDGKNETHYQVLSITCNGFFDYFNSECKFITVSNGVSV